MCMCACLCDVVCVCVCVCVWCGGKQNAKEEHPPCFTQKDKVAGKKDPMMMGSGKKNSDQPASRPRSMINMKFILKWRLDLSGGRWESAGHSSQVGRRSSFCIWLHVGQLALRPQVLVKEPGGTVLLCSRRDNHEVAQAQAVLSTRPWHSSVNGHSREPCLPRAQKHQHSTQVAIATHDSDALRCCFVAAFLTCAAQFFCPHVCCYPDPLLLQGTAACCSARNHSNLHLNCQMRQVEIGQRGLWT